MLLDLTNCGHILLSLGFWCNISGRLQIDLEQVPPACLHVYSGFHFTCSNPITNWKHTHTQTHAHTRTACVDLSVFLTHTSMGSTACPFSATAQLNGMCVRLFGWLLGNLHTVYERWNQQNNLQTYYLNQIKTSNHFYHFYYLSLQYYHAYRIPQVADVLRLWKYFK